MNKNTNTIFIIAGETSGDMHAAVLVRNILNIKNNVIFYGIGGRNLQDNGVKLIYNYKELNFIGFVSIFTNYLKIKRIFSETIDSIKKLDPAILILVDFPGFNLRIIKKIRKFYKGTIIYYISPQLWAWHKSRIKIIRECVDKMLVVFPFEVDFYKKEGIVADFVGHPLKDKVTNFLKNNRKRINPKKQITLLPGSRNEEVRKILPVISKAALKLKETFNAELSILCSENIEVNMIKNLVNNNNFTIYRKDNENDEINYKILLNSDLVITKSGTSNLECCLIGSPFCLVYNTNYLNYLIGKSLIKVNFLSIINILAGKQIVKELIQKDFNIENIIIECSKILTNETYTRKMRENFDIVRENLLNHEILKSAENIICEYLN